MLSELITKIYSKNRDHSYHDTGIEHLLKIPDGTKDFPSNGARIWNATSSVIGIKVSLV